MKKKIVATGVSGLVGSRIVELLQEKYDFISYSLDSGVDITNLEILEQNFQKHKNAKTVIHLAAFTDVTHAWEQNEQINGSCYQVNVVGSKNIAQLCYKYNKHLIHISTDFIFDGVNPPKEGYSEKDAPNPIEWYGKTKLLAESEINKSGVKNVVLRIAFPYKAKPADKKLEPIIKLDLVRKIVAKLQKGEKLSMFSEQIITPTFVDDIVKVVDYCLENKPEGLYHCVGSTSISPYKLAKETAKAFDLDESLIKKTSLEEFLKDNPNDRPRQKNLTINNKKLETDFGIKMKTLNDGLKDIKNQLEV
ncbi:SDR family oxidoreductase [Patescibacteria group bacterium]